MRQIHTRAKDSTMLVTRACRHASLRVCLQCHPVEIITWSWTRTLAHERMRFGGAGTPFNPGGH